MPLPSFAHLHAALGDLIGGPHPPLDKDASAFGVEFGKAWVTFTAATLGSLPAAVMSVVLGAPPPDKADEVLRSLLNANFELDGAGAPSFARNAATGEISLRFMLLLGELEAQDIYGYLANAAEAVEDWAETHFLRASTRARSRGFSFIPSFA